jgi:hypothetical protein
VKQQFSQQAQVETAAIHRTLEFDRMLPLCCTLIRPSRATGAKKRHCKVGLVA